MVDRGARFIALKVGVRSDRLGEFIEGCRDTETRMVGFDAEFVVAASRVPDEGVTADHDRCGPIRAQAAHRAQPRLESSVVALDPIVRILRRVVENVGKEFVDDMQQRCSQIGGDTCRAFAARQHRLEELGGRGDVASFDTNTSMTWP